MERMSTVTSSGSGGDTSVTGNSELVASGHAGSSCSPLFWQTCQCFLQLCQYSAGSWSNVMRQVIKSAYSYCDLNVDVGWNQRTNPNNIHHHNIHLHSLHPHSAVQNFHFHPSNNLSFHHCQKTSARRQSQKPHPHLSADFSCRLRGLPWGDFTMSPLCFNTYNLLIKQMPDSDSSNCKANCSLRRLLWSEFVCETYSAPEQESQLCSF